MNFIILVAKIDTINRLLMHNKKHFLFSLGQISSSVFKWWSTLLIPNLPAHLAYDHDKIYLNGMTNPVFKNVHLGEPQMGNFL